MTDPSTFPRLPLPTQRSDTSQVTKPISQQWEWSVLFILGTNEHCWALILKCQLRFNCGVDSVLTINNHWSLLSGSDNIQQFHTANYSSCLNLDCWVVIPEFCISRIDRLATARNAKSRQSQVEVRVPNMPSAYVWFHLK